MYVVDYVALSTGTYIIYISGSLSQGKSFYMYWLVNLSLSI